jgi:hypothetical protein
MRPQFPGMDPWLEHPDVWPDVHNSLITAIRDTLAPLVLPRYFVGVGSRTTVLTGLDVDRIYHPDVSVHVVELSTGGQPASVAILERPDVQTVEVDVPVDDEEIEETYLTIKELPGRKLVTVMEVLSPTNKKIRDARTDYLRKRHDLIRSGVNFVEIDLLRDGDPMPVRNSPPPNDYRILICRARLPKKAVLHTFVWTVPIPPITVPLLPGDAEPVLDLNAVLHDLMDRIRYDLVLDYDQRPVPSLRPEDEPEAAAILAKARTDARGRPAAKEMNP